MCCVSVQVNADCVVCPCPDVLLSYVGTVLTLMLLLLLACFRWLALTYLSWLGWNRLQITGNSERI